MGGCITPSNSNKDKSGVQAGLGTMNLTLPTEVEIHQTTKV